jgi:ABC-type branched-subunit amino acid transport system substrate-binding protein
MACMGGSGDPRGISRKLVLALPVLMSACGGSSMGTLHLGAFLSQSGDLATRGQEELLAAQLAVDEINASGGVLGQTLVIDNEDDGSDPNRSATVATDLVAKKVPAIVGGTASNNTLVAAGVTIPSGTILISGAATTPALTGLADGDTVFRTCPSDALQGKLLAERATAQGFTSVAVVWIPGAYGAGLTQSFVANFEAAGGTVSFNQMYTPGQMSYHDLLNQVYAATPTPKAILLVAYPVDGAQIVKDYTSAFAANQTFWFFTDATEDPSFVSLVGPSNFTFQHEGTGPGVPSSSAYQTFAAAFATKYGSMADPGTFSPNVYDAVYLLALAMQAGGRADAATIGTALRRVANDGNVPMGPGQFGQARAALTAGSAVTYQTASGAAGLDANGDPITAMYGIWKVVGGMTTLVEPSVSP